MKTEKDPEVPTSPAALEEAHPRWRADHGELVRRSKYRDSEVKRHVLAELNYISGRQITITEVLAPRPGASPAFEVSSKGATSREPFKTLFPLQLVEKLEAALVEFRRRDAARRAEAETASPPTPHASPRASEDR